MLRDLFFLRRSDIPFLIGATALFCAIAAIAAYAQPANGGQTTCPPPPQGVAPGCKVVIVNPAEEAALSGQGNILDMAEWARRYELTGPVMYWRKKLQEAPAGVIPQPFSEPAK